MPVSHCIIIILNIHINMGLNGKWYCSDIDLFESFMVIGTRLSKKSVGIFYLENAVGVFCLKNGWILPQLFSA